MNNGETWHDNARSFIGADPAPRFLLIRFRFIGDVLLLTPLVQILRRRFPSCYLAVLTDAEAAQVVEGHPALDEVIVFRPPAGQRGGKWTQLCHSVKLWWRIRRRGYTVVFNLQPGDRGGLLAWLSGAHCRVGYDRVGRVREHMFFYNVKAPYRVGDRYRVEHMLDTLRAIGIEAPAELPSVGLSEQDRAFARDFLTTQAPPDEAAGGNSSGSGEHPLIVLHPGRPETRKVWPEERFSALADALVEQRGARVVWAGAPAEVARVDRIAAAMRHSSASLAGQATLKQLAAVTERAALFIGIDSAPLHLASAAGTPTIALFGFSQPAEWNPIGEDHIAIHKPLPDHPCHPPQCCAAGNSLCMANIAVADVLQAAERLLDRVETR